MEGQQPLPAALFMQAVEPQRRGLLQPPQALPIAGLGEGDIGQVQGDAGRGRSFQRRLQGAAQQDGDFGGALPAWPIRFVTSGRPYTPALEIDAPDDVAVELLIDKKGGG